VHWTENPNTRILKGENALQELFKNALAEVQAIEKTKRWDGGDLLRGIGKEVERIAGGVDEAFNQTVPPPGTGVVVQMALCPLRHAFWGENEGGTSASGKASFAFTEAPVIARSGIRTLRSNICILCWRKGTSGVELKGGQAGCHDPSSEELRVLMLVKRLLLLGYRAAGLVIVAAVLSGESASQGWKPYRVAKGAQKGAKPPHFVEVAYLIDNKLIQAATAPHPKYLAVGPRLTTAVCARLGVEHKFLPAKMLLGMASVYARAMIAVPSPSELASSEKSLTRKIYHEVKTSNLATRAGIVAPDLNDDDELSWDEATAERYKQALSAQGAALTLLFSRAQSHAQSLALPLGLNALSH
jgi:hypothetical protein